jgi:hypothetical protein
MDMHYRVFDVNNSNRGCGRVGLSSVEEAAHMTPLINRLHADALAVPAAARLSSLQFVDLQKLDTASLKRYRSAFQLVSVVLPGVTLGPLCVEVQRVVQFCYCYCSHAPPFTL